MDLTHTDRLIAKRLLKGDEAAFREVFDLFFPRLYRYVIARIADSDDAKEIVQSTFCKAFERIDSYRGEASLYSWMCRICQNTLIDHARKRKRELLTVPIHDIEATLHEIADTICARHDEPEFIQAQTNLRQLIQAALDHLPARYGDVLEWKYVEGLSVAEIAAKLAVGPKAAESLLTRARVAFREAIVSLQDATDILPHEIVTSGKA